MILKKFLRYVFGQRCLFCGATVEVSDEHLFCDDCAKVIRERQLTLSAEEFPDVVSLYRLDDPARKGLYRFKYGGVKALGVLLGEWMAERYRVLNHQADVITCVPRAKDSLPRMYNQSAVIARSMAQHLKIPFDARLLSKRKGALSQLECPTPLAREKNAQWAYRMGPSSADVTGKRVLLVDDLYTTGATVRACCDLLKQRGAERVLVYTALRTVPLYKFSLLVNYDREMIHDEWNPPPQKRRAFHKRKTEHF